MEYWEVLRDCNLHILSTKHTRSRHEKSKLADVQKEKDDLHVELTSAMDRLTQATASTTEAYLRENWEEWGDRIFGEVVQEGWTRIEAKNKEEVILSWCRDDKISRLPSALATGHRSNQHPDHTNVEVAERTS